MKRFEGNPILKPIQDNPWESRMVFNAAAVYNDNKVHILYRAMGEDGVSRIGYASSSDGYHIEERLANPIFEPVNENERNGCEDPRLTPLNGRYLMAYTALRSIPHFDFQIFYIRDGTGVKDYSHFQGFVTKMLLFFPVK
jgi:predicted GH43/DUF377 family glycosyl hydrolase